MAMDAAPSWYFPETVTRWMVASRIMQAFLGLVILGLDGDVISQFNNVFPESNLPSLMNLSVSTYTNALSPSPFNIMIMFSAIVTLLAIPYSFVARKIAPNFYHMCGLVFIEFCLVVFWLASFAGIASFIASDEGNYQDLENAIVTIIAEENISQQFNYDNAKVFNICKAIAGLGALEFLLSGCNFVFLLNRVIIKWRGEKRAAQERTSGQAEAAASRPKETMEPVRVKECAEA